MSWPAVVFVMGWNEAVAVPEVQETVLTLSNSAPFWSTPEARSMTLPLQLDVAGKVPVTELIGAPVPATAGRRFPSQCPGGAADLLTAAQGVPSPPPAGAC